ncbi:TadE/TadG family type IV pilus assembly protein [Ilumatobacter sp.]|uniref:TadE/TadG family type IV pilus assembly protein n=1 Tax=Ilumatobacter sp. TaxID=1967498 RepID=UPI003B51D55C
MSATIRPGPFDSAGASAEDARRGRGERGAVDAGFEILFGATALIALMLLVVETVAYWHARNVFDEAAAEGARVAAAFDGTCAAGSATADRLIERRASGWASGTSVSCVEAGGIVTVTIRGTTPGVLFGSTGLRADVTESAPRER